MENGAPLGNTLQEIKNSDFILRDGRTFNAKQTVTLNGGSSLLLDQATYQSPQGLTINDTSTVELINSTVDLGGVLTINTPAGVAALSGTGVVRAVVDSAGLIDVQGTNLRFENSSIDQTRGGEIVVGEKAGGGPIGLLELSNVTIDEGRLSVLDGGVVAGPD